MEINNGSIPTNILNHIKLFMDFYKTSVTKANNLYSPNVWTTDDFNKELFKIWSKIFRNASTVSQLKYCSSENNFLDNCEDDLCDFDTYPEADNSTNSKVFPLRVYALIVPDGEYHFSPRIYATRQLHLSNQDYQDMKDYLNDKNNIQTECNSMVNKDYKRFEHVQYISNLKDELSPKVDRLINNRNWMIVWLSLGTVFFLFISQLLINYVNYGIAFTAVALYSHFFNIGLIDRLVGILIYDSIFGYFIHKDNKKLRAIRKALNQ